MANPAHKTFGINTFTSIVYYTINSRDASTAILLAQTVRKQQPWLVAGISVRERLEYP